MVISDALHYLWHAFTAYCTGRWLSVVYSQWRAKKEAREREERQARWVLEDAARRLRGECSECAQWNADGWPCPACSR